MILCHLKMARNCSYPNWRKIMNYVLQVRVYWVNSIICRYDIKGAMMPLAIRTSFMQSPTIA